MPHLPALGAIEPVDPLRGLLVKNTKHPGKAMSPFLILRGVRDAMVVVGKDRPGFEPPTEVESYGEQTPVQHSQPVRPSEMMLSFVRADSEEVGSAIG